MVHSSIPDNSRKSGRNLLRFHGDAAASAVDDAAVNYQAPSIIAAGADAQSISVLTMLVNLCLSLVCIKAPALIERIGSGKKGAITLTFMNLCAWVPLILMFMLAPRGISPVWIAVLWLFNVMPGILLTFQRDNWLSNIVPHERLGRYIGQRLAIKSAFYLGAFCFMGFMLDSMGETNLGNFTFVFVVALVVALADFVIFNFMHDPKPKEPSLPKPENQKTKFGLFDFIGELRTKKLDVFVIFTSLFYLTVGLTGPLYAVYMLKEQHFTYLSFTIIIAAEFLARVISTPFWGRFADKSGNIRVLSIVSRVIPVIPIFWLFCSNVGYLAVVQTMSGICWGAFDLCTQNYVFKVAPPQKRLRYIVYTRCLILFSTALGGLAGVYLLKGIFPIFGSKMLSIFLISGFFRALVVMFLIPKMIDLAMNYAKPNVSPKIDLEILGSEKVTRHGLFYHRAEPMAAVVKNQLAKKNTAVLSQKAPNIARRRVWALDERPVRDPTPIKEFIELPKDVKIMPLRNWAAMQMAAREKKVADQRIEITPSRRPWFQDAEIHSAYTSRVRETAQNEMEKAYRLATSHEGLFYNNYGWDAYKKESLKAALKESRRWKETDNLRPVFVEREADASRQAPWRPNAPFGGRQINF